MLLKWTKNGLKLAVLDAVRSAFIETNEFIDSTWKEECEKKDDSRWGNFLLLSLQKITLDKHFYFRFGTKVLIFCL